MAKRFRYRKMPPVQKFDGNYIFEEFSKVAEEFRELQEAYSSACRKATQGNLTRQDFKDILLEAFDVSQVSQQFIRILIKNHGRYYNLTEKNVYDEGVKKNRVRGYYELGTDGNLKIG